jgi:predicted AAA+ superfamily ATPase
MQEPIPRERLVGRIRKCLAKSPVTVLLGARQIGKTTLARMVAKGQKSVTMYDLERAASRQPLLDTPEATLSDASGLVILDEVQRLPHLFEVLRPICDAPGRKANFLLLGSASPDLVKGVSETLAGRAFFVDVPGFTLEEIGPEHQNRLWLRGGLPRDYLANADADVWDWIENFARTYLERDVPQLGLRVPPEALRRFWTMLAHYHGQIWNGAELGRSLSVTAHTVVHYRDILAGTFMVRVLQPWFENVKKRQVKSPKVYIRDSGLLHWHLGIRSMAELRSHPRYGASWEGFAMEQVLALTGDRDAYFWATQNGGELDLLLLRRGKRWGFEFKCSDAPAMTKSMHMALADLGLERIWAVYPGKERYTLHARAEALPLLKVAEISKDLD